MGQNRTIPYGYCINKGKIEIHTEESKVIKKIFQKYANGTSYLKIANSLTAKGIGYTEGAKKLYADGIKGSKKD